MSADVRRRVALDALVFVLGGGDLERALGDARRRLPPDAEPAFVVELVKGALQWRGRYEAVIAHFSRRRPSSDPRVAGVLLLGLHQLLGMGGVPDYAAVHESVELCRQARRPGATGYVNGLLQAVRRHLAAHRDDVAAAVAAIAPDRDRDPAGHLAAVHSLPRWLVARWLERHGPEATAALLVHTNQPAPVCFHVLAPADPAAVLASLRAAGADVVPGSRHGRALILQGSADRPTLRGWLESVDGLIVQDEGAQELTDWLAGNLAPPVCDLCAAPGGKAVHLAARLAAADRLFALDLRPRRLAQLADTLVRLDERRVVALAGDGTRPPLRRGTFGTVLVDGPCSGTGVLRHHPEGRWRLRPATLARNAERLQALVDAAVDLLVAGGELYYATCSLEPEENENVVQAVLEARSDLEPAPGPDRTWQRTWLPHATGTDGFYAARLRRKA